MNIKEAITTRRTIREFTNRLIDKNILLNILSNASWAPNHGTREPWELIIFEKNKQELFANIVYDCNKNKFSDILLDEYIKHYIGVDTTIVITMPNTPNEKIWEEDFAAVCAYIQNIQLLAWAEEIGVVWKTNTYMYTKEFYNELKIELDKKVVAVLHLGYFDKIPAAKKRTNIVEKIAYK